MAGAEANFHDVDLKQLMETVLPFRSSKYLQDFTEKLLEEGVANPADLLIVSEEALETKLSTHASFNFIEMADAMSLRKALSKPAKEPGRRQPERRQRSPRSRSYDRGRGGYRGGRNNRPRRGYRDNSRPRRGYDDRRPPRKKDDKFKPELWAAVEKSDEAAVQQLLAAGKDTEEKYEGWTPLMKASEEGSVEIVKMLLDKKADLEACNKKGRTALSFAAAPSNDSQNGNKERPTPTEVLRLLLQSGADPKKVDMRQMTPKMHATNMKREDALAMFTEFGV